MKFEVFCRHEDFARRLSFYIFRFRPDDGRREICTSMDEMKFEIYNERTSVDPTFSLHGDVVKPFLTEMANALHKIGIRAEGEPVLENELTATKFHLEDMRQLVFNPSARRKV